MTHIREAPFWNVPQAILTSPFTPGQREKKVPQTVLASLYTPPPPLRAMPIRKQHFFKKELPFLRVLDVWDCTDLQIPVRLSPPRKCFTAGGSYWLAEWTAITDIDVEDILEKDVSTGGSSQPASSHTGRAQGRRQRNLEVGGLVQVQFGCGEMSLQREKSKWCFRRPGTSAFPTAASQVHQQNTFLCFNYSRGN